MKKIILTLIVVVIIIQGASWLMGGMSRSGSGGSGVSVGNGGANTGGVSVGPVKGTAAGATAGDGKQCAVMHGARPAAFPSLPAYEPGEEPRAGLLAFVYETPGFASIDAIQSVGDGTQPNLGWFRWKPARKGEMHLFDAGSGTGMATSRALSYILRGGHEIPFGGSATETLRLQYPELKTGLRCSMHRPTHDEHLRREAKAQDMRWNRSREEAARPDPQQPRRAEPIRPEAAPRAERPIISPGSIGMIRSPYHYHGAGYRHVHAAMNGLAVARAATGILHSVRKTAEMMHE
ncbi:hypothetical protein WV31_10355 [Magnetospirillum sp. ME-1]|uniref:hypothetical protein n=1 Tax=Magnetospirillum sp. ME-1 TaxID=1639348 RepID=UPI000A17EAAA|nr:hypothetical protein [Magnetospirillum sp. ME-1]ARJ66028.1 hypothetical protein WV31_10355 [Magnetospirillum sp. ME-1]